MTAKEFVELDSLCETAGIHWMRGEETEAKLRLFSWRDKYTSPLHTKIAAQEARIAELEKLLDRAKEDICIWLEGNASCGPGCDCSSCDLIREIKAALKEAPND